MSKLAIMSNLSLLSAALIFCCLALISLPVLAVPSPNQNLTNSLHAAVNAAIDVATGSLVQIEQHRLRSNSDREIAALSDCSWFYKQMIENLKKTLEPDPELPDTTPFDVQIWLSGVYTSLDNCRTSTEEMKITPPTYLNLDKASELIHNALKINYEILKETGYDDENLPGWVPDEDFLNLSDDYNGPYTNIVVAQDGSRDYRTINEALDASKRIPGRVVIHIKQGIYYEYLQIYGKKNLFLVGDGIGKTIISGNRSAASNYSTWASTTVSVDGDIVVFRDITIRNAAGREAGQAVALVTSSDRTAYYRCSFEGYQDTLCVNQMRNFFQECQISGTIDFIFGNGRTVINNSTIYARAPKPGQGIVITAQGRELPEQLTGISIINSRFLPDPSQEGDVRKFKSFLGRPWRKYSRVVFIKSFLDVIVDPLGWGDMNGPQEDKTHLYYGEYQNYGPGSSTSGRVKWPGYKVIIDRREALWFSVANFIDGLRWLPLTGVPFTPDF